MRHARNIERLQHAYHIAWNEIGTKETPGEEHTGRILQYHASVSKDLDTVEIPWCASFVNWCLIEAGLPGTGSAAAKSFLDYGYITTRASAGDLVVFWRGTPDGPQGHVGFLVGFYENDVLCLGGNQRDGVNIWPYDRSKVLSYRTV